MKILLTCIALVLCCASGLRAQAPTITARTPVPNATAAAPTSSIQITWSSTMNISTIDYTSVLVRGSMTPTYVTSGTTFAFSTSGNAVTITPDIPFKPNEIITVQVTTAVTDANGTPMAGSQTWSFRAESQSPGQREWYHSVSLASARFYAIATGDFNNDGWVDLAIGRQDSPYNVLIYLNDKDRTFTQSASLSASASSYGITVADINSDGNLDLIVGTASNNEFITFLGQGNGLFQSGISTSVDGVQWEIIADDFTGDGIIDIATSQWGGIGDPSLFTGNNDGSFTLRSSVAKAGKGLFQGDFDGDGDLDILGGLDGADIYRNNGSGMLTLVAGSVLDGFINQWDIGDLDGDGDLDAVASLWAWGNYLSIAINNGLGSFTASTAPSLRVSEIPKGVGLFDYDADGDFDILTTYDEGSGVILLNDGNGNFSTNDLVFTVATSAIRLQKMADFDNDGSVDVLISSVSGAIIYFNDPQRELAFTTTSATAPIAAVGTPAVTSATLDFANIKVPIVISSSSPRLAFSTNNTTFTSPLSFSNNSSVATSQTIYIRYTPTTTAAFSGVATATDGSISTTLSIFGSAYLFAFSPQTLIMPTTEHITTATTSLSLSAVGIQLPIELSVAGNAFAVSTNGTVFSSSATLPASSSSATVYIRFAPDNFGAFNGTLSAVSGIYSTSATLSGEGSIPSNMVTNTNDSGPGSLRLALESATAGTVLVFTTGTNPTFVLSSGPITISHPIVADLTALGTITIDGGGGTAIQLDCGAVGMQLRGVQIVNTPPGISVRSICPAVRGAVIQNQ